MYPEKYQIFTNPHKNWLHIYSEFEKIDWPNVKILDFGCNTGTVLRDISRHVDHKNYVGIDVSEAAIKIASNAYPNAKFIHYNKFHNSYNPEGDPAISITDYLPAESFDLILSFSVFTHMSVKDTKEWLQSLRSLLTEKGLILFTVWFGDNIPEVYANSKTKILNQYCLEEINKGFNRSCYILNYDTVIRDKDELNGTYDHFQSFFNRSSFTEMFEDVEVLGKSSKTTQYICRLKK